MPELKPFSHGFKEFIHKLSGGEEHVLEKFEELRTVINDRATLIDEATEDNIVTVDDDGNIQDSGKDIPSGSVVGTIDTQTLTNKTITQAVISVSGATDDLGSASVSDTAAMTASLVEEADAAGAYGAEEILLINELKADFNLLHADVTAIRTVVNGLLAELRKTGGCGILNG